MTLPITKFTSVTTSSIFKISSPFTSPGSELPTTINLTGIFPIPPVELIPMKVV
jgi:hypothetical protein